MAKKWSTPATREDVQQLLTQVAKLMDVIRRAKEDMIAESRINRDEVKEYLAAAIKDLRHDLDRM